MPLNSFIAMQWVLAAPMMTKSMKQNRFVEGSQMVRLENEFNRKRVIIYFYLIIFLFDYTFGKVLIQPKR